MLRLSYFDRTSRRRTETVLDADSVSVAVEPDPAKPPKCEYVDSFGRKCPAPLARVSHGIPCCPEHADRRDQYFGG